MFCCLQAFSSAETMAKKVIGFVCMMVFEGEKMKAHMDHAHAAAKPSQPFTQPALSPRYPLIKIEGI